jgi:hypothetical protein
LPLVQWFPEPQSPSTSHDVPALFSLQHPFVQWLPEPQSPSTSHLLPALFEKHLPPVQWLPELQSPSTSQLPVPTPLQPRLGHGSLFFSHDDGSCFAVDEAMSQFM